MFPWIVTTFNVIPLKTTFQIPYVLRKVDERSTYWSTTDVGTSMSTFLWRERSTDRGSDLFWIFAPPMWQQRRWLRAKMSFKPSTFSPTTCALRNNVLWWTNDENASKTEHTYVPKKTTTTLLLSFTTHLPSSFSTYRTRKISLEIRLTDHIDHPIPSSAERSRRKYKKSIKDDAFDT